MSILPFFHKEMASMHLFLSTYICQFNDAKVYLNEVLYGFLHKRIVQCSHCLTFKETGD